MEQNNINFSEASALLHTPEAQKLLELLKQQDPAKLQKAAELAAAGNTSEAASLLYQGLNTRQAAELIEKLNRRRE